MDEIYVCPNFLPNYYSSRPGSEDLSITEFYSILHRTVLLGDPGGGKSTFSQKLCYDLATQYEKRLLADRQVTPFLVILRDYASQKQQEPCSILEFINDNIKANYQITSFPSDAVEYLLLNGRAVVIFDGLDELTNTSDRQKIRDDVESFANLYSSVPILITSREVGYKEAPLNEERFNTFSLGYFNEEQVKEYTEKWFKVTTDETEEKRSKKVEAFLNESKGVPDLQKNPLMLGLMCNIYRGEGYIPRNRPDVYEKCADMLFERWDKRRDIKLPSPIQNIQSQIKFTIMYLANWIYSNQSLQGGVIEQKLITKAIEKQGNLLDFAVRCLEFIVPSPRVTKKITKATIDYCITWGCLEKSDNNQYVTPKKLLDNLSQSDEENISSIIDKSKLVLIDCINNNDDYKKILALEILAYPYPKLLFEQITFEEIDLSCQKSLLELLKKHITTSTYRYIMDKTISKNKTHS